MIKRINRTEKKAEIIDNLLEEAESALQELDLKEKKI